MAQSAGWGVAPQGGATGATTLRVLPHTLAPPQPRDTALQCQWLLPFFNLNPALRENEGKIFFCSISELHERDRFFDSLTV